MTPKIQIALLILTILLITACGNSSSVLSEEEKAVEQKTATVVDEAEKGIETPAPSAPKTTAVYNATTSPEATEKITVPEPLPSTTTPVLAAATPTAVAGQELTTKTPTSPPSQPTPTYTPYHTPTRVPIQTAIHTALQADVRAKQGWLTYTDPVLGVSFQYPPDWEILESEPGVFVKFLQDERGHFISFSTPDNPNNLLPFEYLIEEILQYRTSLTKTLLLSEVKRFSGNGFDGAVYQERDSNVVTRTIINYEGMTIRLYLRIRGEIGWGTAPSSDYNSTEQEILKLINSLQISGTK